MSSFLQRSVKSEHHFSPSKADILKDFAHFRNDVRKRFQEPVNVQQDFAPVQSINNTQNYFQQRDKSSEKSFLRNRNKSNYSSTANLESRVHLPTSPKVIKQIDNLQRDIRDYSNHAHQSTSTQEFQTNLVYPLAQKMEFRNNMDKLSQNTPLHKYIREKKKIQIDSMSDFSSTKRSELQGFSREAYENQKNEGFQNHSPGWKLQFQAQNQAQRFSPLKKKIQLSPRGIKNQISAVAPSKPTYVSGYPASHNPATGFSMKQSYPSSVGIMPKLVSYKTIHQIQDVLLDMNDIEFNELPKDYIEELNKLCSIIQFRVKSSNYYRRETR